MPLPGVTNFCGAKTDNGPCPNPAMEPIGRCRMHGGETPTGIASPHWKNGRHSRHRKYLPERMLEAYDESATDPDLLNLRTEIATIDARLVDLKQRVDTGECGETWKALLEAAQEVTKLQRKANAAPDSRKFEYAIEVAEAIETLQELCREGASDYAAWDEVIRLSVLRAKLVEAEMKRRAALKTDIPVEQVAAMLAEIEASYLANVHDPEALKALSADFTRIAGAVRP